MYRCSDIESRLIEILDGNLNQTDLAVVEEHLRDCAGCRNLVAQYQPLFNAEIETVLPVPETLWRGIQNTLNKLEEGRLSQPTLFPKRRPLFGYTFQALGVAMAIVVGVILGWTPETQQTTYEDEYASYYAGALTASAEPIAEVYQQVSEAEGENR